MKIVDMANSVFRKVGFEVKRHPPKDLGYEWYRASVTDREKELVQRVRPYTMTNLFRLLGLMEAVRYVVRNNIPGDIVECGVWRGGSSMLAALTLLEEGDTSRHLYLFDTFEGMSPPTEYDRLSSGQSAREMLAQEDRVKQADGIWCYATLEEVRANLDSTGYPRDKITYVNGKVEDTIPGVLPSPIAILRLDTDWYESTKHELEHMYPHLSKLGVLILDDYGFWAGARKATDEYFAKMEYKPLLQRLDGDARIAIKP